LSLPDLIRQSSFLFCHVESPLEERGVEKPHVSGLFKNVQMQGVPQTESQGVYGYTLSGAVCGTTQQMSVFQQSR
jgi:hypothetical protein